MKLEDLYSKALDFEWLTVPEGIFLSSRRR